jgi:NAD+ kinase
MARKSVAIFSKPGKPELGRAVPALIQWLQQRGYGVIADPETATYAKTEATARSEVADKKPEFVIVLGGDGTLLAAARAVGEAGIPLLAVNLGSLGFLSEVKMDELYHAVELVEKNQSVRDTRATLRCEVVRRGESVNTFTALNDIVITKATIARMTEVDVVINGQFVANYKADGVIVSTPTGSTAYSLAAGGPILEPAVDAFVVTPISPHALTNRALVVRDNAKIKLIVRGTPDEAFLTVDGQSGMEVIEGDEVVCSKSAHHVHLLRLPGRTFFDVLRMKLKWGER